MRAAHHVHHIVVRITSDYHLPRAFPNDDKACNSVNEAVRCNGDCSDVSSVDAINRFFGIYCRAVIELELHPSTIYSQPPLIINPHVAFLHPVHVQFHGHKMSIPHRMTPLTMLIEFGRATTTKWVGPSSDLNLTSIATELTFRRTFLYCRSMPLVAHHCTCPPALSNYSQVGSLTCCI